MRSMIPRRPEPDNIQLPAIDKDTVVYAVVFGVSNMAAFERFHPEFTGADGKLTIRGRERNKDFWQLSKVANFKDAYTAYLRDWLGNKDGIAEDDEPAEISDDKKRKTISKMLNQLVKLIGSGDLTGEDLKTYSEIMKKVGWLKDETEEMMKPIRVLMARCKSECRYRAFVETQVLEGRIFDDCSHCRARAYAEERGFKYDPCKLLDIPQEVIDEIDGNNNVKLEDIISGKVEN